ncbi:putative ABC transporter ATP-binding protein [Lachnospiraceae bacterium]|jgi:putative ABC transport system ATP-binding protein|nr:ABC transporter ATP-binding protein [Eubacterium sp.]GFI27750.1 putative ABC transporter ATP-binding protein [Lachnospiraceae bacterium]
MGVLEVKNVSYYYSKDRMVVDDVSEIFERGKMYVILGPSGCGKTTLLSLLGGLDLPKAGQVLFEGQEVRKKELEEHRRSHISFVFQNYNLIDYMTPVENVELTARQEALPILEKLGLSREEAKRNVLKLSGGQQQRVAIARALASGNPVILADEPTGNLDEDMAKEITGIFQEAAKEYDKCVVIVSHSNEVAKQADVVLEMDHGKLNRVEAK